MTDTHPNAQVLGEFFEAFGAADRTRLASLMTADLVAFPRAEPHLR